MCSGIAGFFGPQGEYLLFPPLTEIINLKKQIFIEFPVICLNIFFKHIRNKNMSKTTAKATLKHDCEGMKCQGTAKCSLSDFCFVLQDEITKAIHKKN